VRKENKSVGDPTTYWLNLTNAGLGIVVVLCCVAVGFGVVQELAARRKKKAPLSGLDREVAGLVDAFRDGHAFHVPGLGVTMADGGEEQGKKEKR
jgi:hypothetical protein